MSSLSKGQSSGCSRQRKQASGTFLHPCQTLGCFALPLSLPREGFVQSQDPTHAGVLSMAVPMPTRHIHSGFHCLPTNPRESFWSLQSFCLLAHSLANKNHRKKKTSKPTSRAVLCYIVYMNILKTLLIHFRKGKFYSLISAAPINAL